MTIWLDKLQDDLENGTTYAPSPPDPNNPNPNPNPNTPPPPPPDPQTNCSFIDIPCNLRALFIPRKEWIQSKMQSSLSVNLPSFKVSLIDKFDIGPIDIPAPINVKATIPIDFSSVVIPQVAKDIFGFLSFWGVLFVIFRFFNIPILGNKGSDSA